MMVSPQRTVTAPSASLASLPVSIVIGFVPTSHVSVWIFICLLFFFCFSVRAAIRQIAGGSFGFQNKKSALPTDRGGGWLVLWLRRNLRVPGPFRMTATGGVPVAVFA